MHRGVLPLGIALSMSLIACSGSSSNGDAAAPSSVTVKVNPNDPEFKKRVQARLDEITKEESVREEAPWFGKTGLLEEDERELPRYLRREFGVLLSEPGALRASDLEYRGVFTERGETIHYWRINHGSAVPKYAYIVTAPKGHEGLGWGNRQPAP